MRRLIVFWLVAGVGLVLLGLGLAVRTTDLARAFDTGRAEAIAVPREATGVLTEADIAHLPAPVRRYIALTGAIGRPVVTEVTLKFEATLYDAPGATGMTGPVMQYDRFDLPRRLFLMTTRMNGLPVAVLHDFDTDRATMRVRLAGLVNVVDAGGPELTRTETVTILNDLCCLAPSRLIDPRLTWIPVDDTRAKVAFTLGPNTVSAELVFNAAGELEDFASEDRGMLQKDGSLRVVRWTTPLSTYRRFDGWRLASEGNAIWHLPEGPFIYVQIRLTHLEAR